jgi:acetoin utilization protein AcuB
LTVEQVMNPDFVTVPPVVPLEEAALIMLEKHIDRLLIVEQGKLVGIITSSDIFRSLVTILGGGSTALRLTVEVNNTPGQLAKLAGDIASLGGNIISIATASSTEERWAMVLRIEQVDWPTLKALLDTRSEYKILHVCGENGSCAYNPE